MNGNEWKWMECKESYLEATWRECNYFIIILLLDLYFKIKKLNT